MSITFRIAVMSFCLALLAAPASAADPPDFKVPNKDWIKGPVKWIMTKEDIKAFKKLRTDEERASFAEKFWLERDPTPDTPVNEYEVIFWQRVESADNTFTTEVETGSVTDMGRVFILLGPPANTDKDSRNRQLWTYEPNEVTGIDAHMEVTFAPTNVSMLLLDRKTLQEYVDAHPATRGIGWEVPVIAVEPGGLEAAPVEEVVEDLSPESLRQIPILEAILAEGGGRTDVQFELSYDFYAAVDGSTLSVVTMEIPRQAAHGSGDDALLPFARLAPSDPEAKAINITGELPFVPAPITDCPPESFIYQARRNLKPGVYTIAAVVEDRVVLGAMGTLVETVTVPDYSDREFEMSTVSLLSQFRPIDAGLGPDEGERGAGPYVLGSFRLVPRASSVLRKDESLTFYYQVYGPATDPATGRPRMEATYTFFLKENGAWQPFRLPIQKAQGQVELYSIDLKDLLRPNQELPAEFKMEAKLTDKISSNEITRDILFTVR